MKIFYSYFVSDNVYHFYKFSIYGRNKVTLVAAGLAYDNHGNYSKEFKKLKEKYQPIEGSMTTSHDLKEFICRLYLDSAQAKVSTAALDIHPIHYQIFKHTFDIKQNEEIKLAKRNTLFFLRDQVEPILGKIEDEAKEEMCRLAFIYFR